MRSCEGHFGTDEASCQPCSARGHAGDQVQVVRSEVRAAIRAPEIARNVSRQAVALRAELSEFQ